MNDIVWDNVMLAEFRSLACLSSEEDKVLQMWSKDDSVVEMAFALNVSTRTVDRILSRIRLKYDNVRPYTPLLPDRNILS